MKEIPLIFTGPMVRAILEGRKTQTRRLTGQILRPGDRIWVKETHWWFKDWHDPVTGYFPERPTLENVKYHADGTSIRGSWRSPMFMPRWASRITLEVTAPSRMERLHDITEAGAQAEGIPWSEKFSAWCGRPGSEFYFGQARLAFKSWWIHLHGAQSWYSNPEVTVITFRRVTS